MIDTHILDTNTPLQSDSSTKTMWFRLARLCTIYQGGEPTLEMYVGKRDSLGMDPTMLKFETADEFLNYTPSIGGDLLLGRINTKDNHDQMAWHCHPKSQTERG